MADWPSVDELTQVLNLSVDPQAWTTTIERIHEAAIQQVKDDVGDWDDDVDEPDAALAQAALRAGELIAERPEAQASNVRSRFVDDPTYARLLKGHRRRFAISGGTT